MQFHRGPTCRFELARVMQQRLTQARDLPDRMQTHRTHPGEVRCGVRAIPLRADREAHLDTVRAAADLLGVAVAALALIVAAILIA